MRHLLTINSFLGRINVEVGYLQVLCCTSNKCSKCTSLTFFESDATLSEEKIKFKISSFIVIVLHCFPLARMHSWNNGIQSLRFTAPLYFHFILLELNFLMCLVNRLRNYKFNITHTFLQRGNSCQL